MKKKKTQRKKRNTLKREREREQGEKKREPPVSDFNPHNIHIAVRKGGKAHSKRKKKDLFYGLRQTENSKEPMAMTSWSRCFCYGCFVVAVVVVVDGGVIKGVQRVYTAFPTTADHKFLCSRFTEATLRRISQLRDMCRIWCSFFPNIVRARSLTSDLGAVSATVSLKILTHNGALRVSILCH